MLACFAQSRPPLPPEDASLTWSDTSLYSRKAEITVAVMLAGGESERLVVGSLQCLPPRGEPPLPRRRPAQFLFSSAGPWPRGGRASRWQAAAARGHTAPP